MERYFALLNKKKELTLQVKANMDNLGNSCWAHTKSLKLKYQCVNYDPNTGNFGKALILDNGYTQKWIEINENQSYMLDCRSAKE